jgi:hypothetical protein
MRSIWRTIWILGALLLIAALDNRRDPPATNPDGPQLKLSKASCLQESSHGKASQPCESLASPSLFPIHFVPADPSPADRLSTWLVLTEHAADASPPGLQSRRKPHFLS